MGDHFEVLGGQIVNGFRVGREFSSLRQLQVKNGDIQPSLGGNLGIQLSQRSRCRIPGIGHQRLALDLLKDLAGHIDLAPDDQPGQLVRQDHGNGANSAKVFCYILPYSAITPGGAPDEYAVPVLQGHRQSVYLGFYAVLRLRQRAAQMIQKLPHLVAIEHIL